MQHLLPIIVILGCRFGNFLSTIPGTDDEGGADYGNNDEDNTILAALALPSGVPLPPPLLQLQPAAPPPPPPTAQGSNWNSRQAFDGG